MSSPSKSPRDSARQEEEEGPKVAEKWINSYREEPERERMNEPNEDPSETWTTEGGFFFVMWKGLCDVIGSTMAPALGPLGCQKEKGYI